MAPSRRGDLAAIAVRALFAGTVTCFITACVAGMYQFIIDRYETGRHRANVAVTAEAGAPGIHRCRRTDCDSVICFIAVCVAGRHQFIIYRYRTRRYQAHGVA